MDQKDSTAIQIESALQKPVYLVPYLGNRGSFQILKVLSEPHQPLYILTNS
jgi:hypothetical protein